MVTPRRLNSGPDCGPKEVIKYYWAEFSDYGLFKRVFGTLIASLAQYDLDIPEDDAV